MKDTGERLIPELHDDKLIYGEHIARYVLSAELVKNKKVLDIASGTGYGANLLSDTAKHVTGVDISEEAINYAKKHYSKKNIEFKKGSADKIPFDEGSFDVVNSFETIEHINTYKEFVSEAKRVLRPGGVFIVSTPNKKEFVENNHYHVHEFTEDEFRKLLKASFKHVEFYYQESFKGSSIHGKDDFSIVWKKNEPVYKTLNQPKEKAIYFIALCSDRKLQNYGSINVIAENWSDKALAKEIEVHNKNIIELQKAVTTLRQEKEGLQDEVFRIRQSLSWKVTKPLRGTKKAIGKLKRKK